MTHRRCRELLILMRYDEVPEKESAAAREHLSTCGPCRAEHKRLSRFDALLGMHVSPAPAVGDMEDARRMLRARIAAVGAPGAVRDLFARLRDLTGVIRPATVFAIVAAIAIGMVAGLYLARPGTHSSGEVQADASPIPDDGRIMNLRLARNAGDPADVTLNYDAVVPRQISGNLRDPAVQRILAFALINDDNPGIRLAAASAFAGHPSIARSVDPEVKSALLLTLRTDTNPGVRKEALSTLRLMTYDQQIRDGFLYVLMHDGNTAMRIAAINALQAHVGPSTDPALSSIMRETMTSDQNPYVRVMARTVLENLQHQ